MSDVTIKEIGQVVEVSPPVVKIEGLPHIKQQEVIKVAKQRALVFRFRRQYSDGLYPQDFAWALSLGDPADIEVGDEVERTGKLLKIPVGNGFLGKIINPLGIDIETGDKIDFQEEREIENLPTQITERGLVREPLETGIKLVDALIPIGRGQRELILGDRKTGKTALAIDAILNQKKKDVICIYCSIGQRRSEMLEVESVLTRYGARDYTVYVVASASDAPILQYLAPFSAMTLAEYFRDKGKDVLVIFDDLTKHAWIWRQISLLLNAPPGREAYPGDIFYLHARLLERAGKLLKGGSITALPICETKEGDITEYIPTNLISITDGQIYLETDLFQQGIKPAINIGLSVSRIGSFAQRKYLKEATKGLKLLLSQHKELKKLVQLETKISGESQKKFQRGELLLEIFKQNKHELVDSVNQSILYFAVTNGLLDDIGLENISKFEQKLYKFLDNLHYDFKQQLIEHGWTEIIKNRAERLIKKVKLD